MITQDGLVYTIDELAEMTGYSEGTIYNLTNKGVVPKPVRGMVQNNPGKGVYTPEALRWLQKYKELRGSSLSCEDAAKQVIAERNVA